MVGPTETAWSILKSILVVVLVSVSQAGGSTRIKMALTPIQRPLVPPRNPSTLYVSAIIY